MRKFLCAIVAIALASFALLVAAPAGAQQATTEAMPPCWTEGVTIGTPWPGTKTHYRFVTVTYGTQTIVGGYAFGWCVSPADPTKAIPWARICHGTACLTESVIGAIVRAIASKAESERGAAIVAEVQKLYPDPIPRVATEDATPLGLIRREAMNAMCGAWPADRAKPQRCIDGPPPLPPPPPPPASRWVVAPTSICPSSDKDTTGRCVRRQTYVWADDARSAQPAEEKVDIGAPCDESIGAASFYGVLGRTDRVALCVRN